jgi:hypothetical protein
VQHRREEDEILARDQRHFNVRPQRQMLVEILRRRQPGKSATGNDYLRGLHRVVSGQYTERRSARIASAASTPLTRMRNVNSLN